MEILLFTMVGVILYVASDAILKMIEKRAGKTLDNRSIIFFIIIMVMSVVTFNLLQHFGPEMGLLSSQDTPPAEVQSQP